MAKPQKYIPVSCHFMDHVELLAIKGKPVNIYFKNENGKRENIKEVIKTWLTEKGEEFLIIAGNRKIRMDKIIQIEDIILSEYD